jgi:hypothetical protein
LDRGENGRKGGARKERQRIGEVKSRCMKRIGEGREYSGIPREQVKEKQRRPVG